MTRTIWMLLFIGLAGCGDAEVTPPEDEAPAEEEAPEPEPVAKDSPEALAALANKIAAEPDKQEELLKAEGWTRDEFEAAIIALAKDPAKSKSYIKARRGR